MKKDFKAISGVFPMPVLLIATYNEDGSVDVMNAAWSMAETMTKIRLNISKGHKTTKNLIRTGACTISLGVKKLLDESDFFGIVSANNYKNKFESTNLTATKSDKVDAPIINEYPLTMECVLDKDSNDAILVDVKNILVDDEYLNEDGTINLEKMEIIAYDPFSNHYHVVGKSVGKAFSAGLKLKK